MKKISELELGYRDAENYKRRENKNLFNKLFLRTESLEKLTDQNISFLMGEKGTGKTAYAVYLANNHYKNNFASLKYIRETEYQKFMAMKKAKNLSLSDYTNIWKVILYLLMAQQIQEREIDNSFFGFSSKFKDLKKAIDEYYQHSFSPEIIYAIQFAEGAKSAAEIISKFIKISGEENISISFSEQRFQTNLRFIEKHFEDAFSSLKLQSNHILFIDGIDIRPSSIPFDEYLDCVKGLANAIWTINMDFFSNIKDSKGRLRIVLLIRPDIFDILGLQNKNSKIQDNSVSLNWLTSYVDHRNSNLFMVADRLIGSQQEENLSEGDAWDYYFPFNARNVLSHQSTFSSFIIILRYSLYRPRNILAILSILKENHIEQRKPKNAKFEVSDFEHPTFTKKYSEHLLGEVKDQLSFHYTNAEYELFIKFFHFLNGRSRFTYEYYIESYESFIKFINTNNFILPPFFDTPDNYLQFMYDLDVMGYFHKTTDGDTFFGWCHKDRSTSNIAPKVKTHVEYEIHYGLMKALFLGKHFVGSSRQEAPNSEQSLIN